MAVALRCIRCGRASRSSLFYRGPGEHACSACGGDLVLADTADERRDGADRRADPRAYDGEEWRSGDDRRRSSGAT